MTETTDVDGDGDVDMHADAVGKGDGEAQRDVLEGGGMVEKRMTKLLPLPAVRSHSSSR